jgi:hypothetical protein
VITLLKRAFSRPTPIALKEPVVRVCLIEIGGASVLKVGGDVVAVINDSKTLDRLIYEAFEAKRGMEAR